MAWWTRSKTPARDEPSPVDPNMPLIRFEGITKTFKGDSAGEEAETVAPGVIQVTDTQSVALTGLHWTSTAWGFSWEAGWYEQGDLYDRIRVRVGFEHRF